MTSTRPSSLLRKQAGGALLIALVMIFMLSILGISAMRGSTLERQMATNSIQKQNAFQAAESATEVGLNDARNLTKAFIANGGEVGDVVEIHESIGMANWMELRYVGEGIADGFSAGSGSNNFIALRYEVDGFANIDDVRAGSSIRQGAYRVVPAP